MVADLIDVLIECEEYFDQRADAEYFPDKAAPVGNEEMRLLTEIREVLTASRAANKSDKPFTECSECGTPQVSDTHSLVLMFKTPEDRAEFKAVVEAEIGDRMTAYSVTSPSCDSGDQNEG